MSAPAIVLILLGAMGLGVEMAKDGKPREGKHSFFTHLLALSITHLILWWGGWYS